MTSHGRSGPGDPAQGPSRTIDRSELNVQWSIKRVRLESSPGHLGRHELDARIARGDGTLAQSHQAPAQVGPECGSSSDEQRLIEQTNGPIHVRT